MSDIYKKIQNDIKEAMKRRSERELIALRLLKSDIQYEMNKTGKEILSDSEVLLIIKRAVNKRSDSIEQFEKAGRAENVANEMEEMGILKRYLPEEVSEEQILKVVNEVFDKIKPSTPGEMGKVIGGVMSQFKGQNIDGNIVKKLVQNRFSS